MWVAECVQVWRLVVVVVVCVCVKGNAKRIREEGTRKEQKKKKKKKKKGTFFKTTEAPFFEIKYSVTFHLFFLLQCYFRYCFFPFILSLSPFYKPHTKKKKWRETDLKGGGKKNERAGRGKTNQSKNRLIAVGCGDQVIM